MPLHFFSGARPKFRPVPARVYWIAYAALAMLLHWGHLVNPDEGLTLTQGWQITQGLVPYRDFFDFKTPGSFYVLAAVFTLFGVNYAAAKIFSIALLVFSGYGVYRIGRYLDLGERSYLPPVLWLLLSTWYVLINYHSYSILVGIWAVERLAFALRREERHVPAALPYGIAGLAAGATVWMQQGRGAAVLVAAMVCLAWQRRFRSSVFFIAGFFVSLLPMLALPLSLFWQQVVLFPFVDYYPSNAPLSPWPIIIVAFGHSLLGIALLRQKTAAAFWKVLWATGLLLILSNFSHSDYAHVLSTLFPAALLLAVWLQEAGRQRYKISWMVANTVLGVSVAVLAFSSFFQLALRIGQVGPRAFVQLRDPQLEQLVASIRDRVPADRPIFVAPFLPNFYFEAKRRNPTRFNFLIYGQHPAALFAEARQQLEADPPAVVILNYWVAPENFRDFLIGNPLTNYIREYYNFSGRFNGVQVYYRRTW